MGVADGRGWAGTQLQNRASQHPALETSLSFLFFIWKQMSRFTRSYSRVSEDSWLWESGAVCCVPVAGIYCLWSASASTSTA